MLRPVAIASVLVLIGSSARAAEPWVNPDPDGPPTRYAIPDTDIGIAMDAEYRAQFTLVNPVDLNSERNRRFNTLEHRGRLGATVDYDEVVKITTSIDLLDGVLWGDNGTFGGDPSSDIGVAASARDPNIVKPCIRQLEDDATVAASYGWGLCKADAVKVRRLFAQVNTPIGAIRVGRQPVSVGMGVQTAAGDGRRNRFGVAYEGDSVDRIMFATKPLEAFKPKEERNLTETEGMIVAVLYDRWVTDTARLWSDDINQAGGAIRYMEPDFLIGKDFELTAYLVHRWDGKYDTHINAFGGRMLATFERFSAGFDMAANVGKTREISEGYALITNDTPTDQQVLQYGGRFVARYDWKPVTAYVELDYASGDGNPEPGSRLSQFRFSEDTNVGLLLFDHILRYQSARAAAAGVEVIRALGAETFPPERIDTRGAFTSALAIFPQIDIRPHDTLLFRLGTLVAWSPAKVVNPVESLQRKDGLTIADNLVNFAGGPARQFYGVELDGRFQWRLFDHFALDLEAAVLFPGDALEDANGDAVNSWLTQGRTTFFF